MWAASLSKCRTVRSTGWISNWGFPMPKKQAEQYTGAARAAAEHGYEDYWANLTVSHASHPGKKFRYELIADALAVHGIEAARVIDCGCVQGSLLDVVSDPTSRGESHGT